MQFKVMFQGEKCFLCCVCMPTLDAGGVAPFRSRRNGTEKKTERTKRRLQFTFLESSGRRMQ